MHNMSLILGLCIVTLTACNLAYRSPVDTVAESVSTEIDDVASDLETETIAASQNLELTGSPVLPCSPRVDWPLYIVVAGDTLSDIALRSASTVEELAAANCLEDVRLIIVQQRLYLPRLPQ